MKKLFLATVSVVALAGSALAADMPVYKAAPVVAAPACAQFGGFFVGGNVGWKYYNNDWKDKDNFGYNLVGIDSNGDGLESDNGWTAGAQVGYNFQWHCVVWGVQADWNWTNVSVSNTFFDDPYYPDDGSFAYSSKEKWYGTLRTRSGIVVDNLLLYVTGGFAWAKFDRGLSFAYPDDDIYEAYSSSATKLGFVVGAGTEWSLNQNWSITSEFLYMGFEKDNQTFYSPEEETSVRYEFKDSQWVAKFGINYRFGGAAPVVARY